MLEAKKWGGILCGGDHIMEEKSRVGSDPGIHTATMNKKYICHS